MALLPTIASGLAGWLTYEDMRRKVRHHEEGTLYSPIIEIAEANGYKVKHEFPIPGKPKRKSKRTVTQKEVDFVMISQKSKATVVLEVKFKKTAMAMAGGIGEDAIKIRDLDGDLINTIIEDKHLDLPKHQPGYKLYHAVMVVWREGDLIKAIRQKEPKPIQSQFLNLMRAMLCELTEATGRTLAEAMLGNAPIKPVNARDGSLRWGSTYTHKRYWVAILRKQPGWKLL